jgi:ubiquinone/menaquinone biosynthesis C-methylase UbiE
VEVEEYARIAAAEDEHWWYRNTRAVMRDLLEPWLGSGQRILDAGCGPGGNGAWLCAHGDVVGVDVSSDALAFVRARRPGTTPVQGSIDALPFPEAAFDVAVAITVVTCVPDDQRALVELARVLRPGGVLLLMEPAFAALRRAHDKTVHSLHRYRRDDLTARLARAGIHVTRATYVYSFLVPPAAALAAAERLRPHPADAAGSDVERRGLDGIFTRLARCERAWLARRDLPFGTTVAIVGTRAPG